MIVTLRRYRHETIPSHTCGTDIAGRYEGEARSAEG
jgi:hypothetical protein